MIIKKPQKNSSFLDQITNIKLIKPQPHSQTLAIIPYLFTLISWRKFNRITILMIIYFFFNFFVRWYQSIL